MVDKEENKIKVPKEEGYLSLVRSLYKEKGFRPISKAMTEASRLWSKKTGVSLPKEPKI